MPKQVILPNLLGPFIGHTTDKSSKIWLQVSDLPPGGTMDIQVLLREGSFEGPSLEGGTLAVRQDCCGTGIVELNGLKPDTIYYYLLKPPQGQNLDLAGLQATDLHFKTLPEGGFDEQLDFLLMSCHNPDQKQDDGFEGFAVWSQIPEILKENKNVRFALLGGDQVYADDVETRVLAEADEQKRIALYLERYRRYWRSLEYRRVLCSLPSYLMWDDHDITDGWGSREDSYEPPDASGKASDKFKPEWQRLFQTASAAFKHMQASRNPQMPEEGFKQGFDCCFRVGRAGFIMADLRSNRNSHKRILWLPGQYETVGNWIKVNRADLDTIFFISPVVFSHGDPKVDELTRGLWPLVMWGLAKLANRFERFKGMLDSFNKNLGDLRDDIDDSWGSEINKEEADRILDLLFNLQNPKDGTRPIRVVILSGDIHTPGYSTIYSGSEEHATAAAIPHIVASPVSYAPFSWPLEAYYRHLTKSVFIGAKKQYTAQISHHFCHRNVVVVSLRRYGSNDSFLKVKYYLEGFSEPQIMFFDLNRGSHREAIDWSVKSRELSK